VGNARNSAFHQALTRVIRQADGIELADCAGYGRGMFLSPDERICPRCESTAVRLTRRGFFEVVFDVRGDAVEVLAVREPVETTSRDEIICRSCGYDIGQATLDHVRQVALETATGTVIP
jgi:hypothetical protein